MERFGQTEFAYIQQVFESGQFGWHTGPWVKQFEARFAERHGVGWAVASNSCMSSLMKPLAG